MLYSRRSGPASNARHGASVTAQAHCHGRRQGELARNDTTELARNDFARGLPCILICASAIALLAHLFESFLQLSDAFLGERQLVGGERVGVGVLARGLDGAENAGPVRAGRGGSLGLGVVENGVACPARYDG